MLFESLWYDVNLGFYNPIRVDFLWKTMVSGNFTTASAAPRQRKGAPSGRSDGSCPDTSHRAV